MFNKFNILRLKCVFIDIILYKNNKVIDITNILNVENLIILNCFNYVSRETLLFNFAVSHL